MSITRAQIATQLLNKMAPKGEKLAYINNREAELLKRMGGAGVDINKTGIKSYYYDEVGQTMGGTGFQDTSSLTGGSGNDGGSSYDYIPQPTVAKLNTINTSDRGGDTNPYGLRSKFQRGLDKALPYLAGFIGSKLGPYTGYKAYDSAKTNQEKRQEELNRFTNAINTGSFYVPGQTGLPEGLIAKSDSLLGFQNRTPEPTINTGGGDNQIIPRMQMIAEAPSDVESTPSDFDLYAALEGREGMRFGENPYDIRGVTQRFEEGGEVRQAYGLGKLVKKATRAVKKVLKSDIGKAALLYAGGTYLGGMKAFGGSGIGGAKKLGFQNFGGRLLNPTGTDGIANLLNPFRSTGGGDKLPFVQTEEQKSAELAKKIGLIEKSALSDSGKEKLKDSLITKSLNIGKSEIPGYVKYGIPAAMLATYGAAKKEEPDDLDQEIAQNYTDNSGLKEQLATYKPFRFEVEEPYRLSYAADGGRIGYEIGGDIDPADLPMSKEGFPRYEDESGEEVPYPYDNQEMASEPNIDAELFQMYLNAIGSGKIPRSTTFDQYKELMEETTSMSSERTMANEGGLMNLGGNEMDLRGGGFVPIGVKEKADDVPARLSKNEFVFTADAVRAAGGGDVDTGADLMYKTMKNLESRVG
jgi:hypothetical protein